MTYFAGTTYPALGAGMVTTPDQYLLFLRKMFLGELLPRRLHDAMETDQYPAALRSAGDDGWHYGFTSWLECPRGVTEWGPACRALRVHSSAGAGGFRPQLNRELGYYIQVAYYGVPAVGSQITRTLVDEIRPLIAAILRGAADERGVSA